MTVKLVNPKTIKKVTVADIDIEHDVSYFVRLQDILECPEAMDMQAWIEKLKLEIIGAMQTSSCDDLPVTEVMDAIDNMPKEVER